MKLNTSLNDLAVKLRIHGRHLMLSYLSSLPIAVLRSLDTEANRFYDRNHQMYDAALLTRCYTQHALRPFIDSESNHIRSFIKIPFINKGIDFIDLTSIFQDKSVIQSIPTYFQNSEPPIICYKYNKPIRNTIFNFNKKVQVGKDQEKAQSEKDSHSKNRGGKKPNQQSGTYTMKHIVSRMSSYFPNRWPLSYLNLTKNMKTYIRRQQHKKFFKHQDIKRKEPPQKYRLGTISNTKLLAGLNRFYMAITSPSASAVVHNI